MSFAHLLWSIEAGIWQADIALIPPDKLQPRLSAHQFLLHRNNIPQYAPSQQSPDSFGSVRAQF